MIAILIGGTPSTGKTKAAKILASKINVEIIGLGDLADKSGCISAYDKARDTGVIDEDCLVYAIIDLLEAREGRVVIEGHYIDLVPNKSVERAFILRTHPEILRERLSTRSYPEHKIIENVEAEVLGICQMDALESFGEEKVSEIDTTSLSPIEVADKMIGLLEHPSSQTRIDWMSMLEKEGRLDEFLSD